MGAQRGTADCIAVDVLTYRCACVEVVGTREGEAEATATPKPGRWRGARRGEGPAEDHNKAGGVGRERRVCIGLEKPEDL